MSPKEKNKMYNFDKEKKGMKNINFLLIGLLTFCIQSMYAQDASPNILVILCDDLGYADVGFNGSKDITTPNLDFLARGGKIFKSAYVAHPFCGPSRAAIMTGRYPHEIGTPYNLRGEGIRIDKGVPEGEKLISAVLKESGYFTGLIGKWHLGFTEPFQPNNRGFDEFFGFLGGGHEYFPNQFRPIYEKQKKDGIYPIREYVKPLLHNSEEVTETEYLTDAFSREAVNFLEQAGKKQKPFFLFLSYNAPHVPLQAKAEDLKMFSQIEDRDRRVYAAMVYAIDRGVGRITDALKKSNQFENTLIVFLSDNGGNVDHGASNAPLKGTKGDTWEGGFRTPMFIHWPKKIAAGTIEESPVSALDFYPTFSTLAQYKIPLDKNLSGEDITGLITGKEKPSDDRFIFSLRYREGYNDVAARHGDWKIVRSGNEPWQLINIKEDIGEHYNLSGRYPEKLNDLVKRTQKWTEGHIAPLWYYSAKDEILWEKGVLPGYDSTFETSVLTDPPSSYIRLLHKRTKEN